MIIDKRKCKYICFVLRITKDSHVGDGRRRRRKRKKRDRKRNS